MTQERDIEGLKKSFADTAQVVINKQLSHYGYRLPSRGMRLGVIPVPLLRRYSIPQMTEDVLRQGADVTWTVAETKEDFKIVMGVADLLRKEHRFVTETFRLSLIDRLTAKVRRGPVFHGYGFFIKPEFVNLMDSQRR